MIAWVLMTIWFSSKRWKLWTSSSWLRRSMSSTLSDPPVSWRGGHIGRHQLALGGIAGDLVLRRIVERLRELLFLRADHVANVAVGVFVVFLAPAGGGKKKARSVIGSLLVTMTSVRVFLPAVRLMT